MPFGTLWELLGSSWELFGSFGELFDSFVQTCLYYVCFFVVFVRNFIDLVAFVGEVKLGKCWPEAGQSFGQDKLSASCSSSCQADLLSGFLPDVGQTLLAQARLSASCSVSCQPDPL